MGCSTAPVEPLKLNPCSVLPGINSCQAVPINQYLKPEFERIIMPGDICFTLDDYATLQKNYREVLKRCGELCH